MTKASPDALPSFDVSDPDIRDKLRQHIDGLLAANDGGAMFTFARRCQRGEFGDPDFAMIRSLYEREVELGSKAAMFNLALMYRRGECAGVDAEKANIAAKGLYEQAAAKGHHNAMLNLGAMYRRGDGVPQDHAKAFALFEAAAAKGNTSALFNLGQMYGRGDLGSPDLVNAKRCFEKASEDEHAASMFNLALIYADEAADEETLARVKDLYERAAAKNHADSMYNLALMYYVGEFGELDRSQAAAWLEKAAGLRDADAMFVLAKMHKFDEFPGSDEQKALALFSAAAELGHPEAPSFLPNPMIAAVLASLEAEKVEAELRAKAAVALENLEERFFDLRSKHLIQEPVTLAHFTTWSAIESLLSLEPGKDGRNCLRQYLVDYMNDPSEGRRLLNFCELESSAEFPDARAASELLRELFDTQYFGSFARHNSTAHLLPSVFTVSLTQESDRLDLWRAYGRDGEGYCLVLPIPDRERSVVHVRNRDSSKVFLPEQSATDEEDAEGQLLGKIVVEPPLLYWIKYQDEDVVELLEELMEPLSAVLELQAAVSPPVWDRIASCATAILLELLYLFKDEQYSTEKEARALTVMRLDNPKIRIDERKPGCLYCETPAFLFGAPQSEVILGPKVDKPTAALWNIRYRLTQLGFDGNTVVKRSRVPYR
ncbi:tetratricopeptide repeat protein [Massilia sp. GCM10023247]|uniref:tetratricopeptide repeat protein n=1 Tax=Massilia sp. GCM10023247 TaxID=3252643 RepID=UPI003609AD0E